MKKRLENHVRKGKGGTENTRGGVQFCVNGKRIYPTQYHAHFWCCVRTQ